MKTTCILLPSHRRFAMVLSLSLWIGVTLGAQTSSTGTITGRVYEEATGRSLQGATVVVVGTTAVDYTDADGRFTLPAVPAGNYVLEVEYVGLDIFKQSVRVSPGASLAVNPPLKSEVLKMAPFEVAEAARGQALAINQQKTAIGIVNIVSEETFGQMVSGNIGYALQRLPGLTVNEDSDGTPGNVNIRGLEGKYNSFQIDDNRLPTSGTSRAFSTGQLNGDGISNIEVIKAATPDRDGDAIGGIINVKSRSAFQREGRTVEVIAKGIYYDMTQKFGYNAGLNYLDIFNVAGGEKNLGVSLNLTTHKISRDYHNIDKDYTIMRPEFEPALNLKEPIYFHRNGTLQTNFRDTTTRGVNLAIDYRLSPRSTLFLRPFYSQSKLESVKPLNRLYVNSNHNFASATGTKSIAESTYNTGRSIPTALNEIRYQTEDVDSGNDAYGFAAGGKHELDTIVVSYDAFRSANETNRDRSFTYVVRNQGFNIAYDHTDRSQPKYTILNGKSPLDLTTINRGDFTLNPRDASETSSSAKLDVEKKFVGAQVSGSLKVGAKYRLNEREQDQSSTVYRTGTFASGFPYADLLRPSNRTVFGTPMSVEPDGRKVEALLRSSPNLFALQASESLLNNVVNDFDAEEGVAASYAMGTLRMGRHLVLGGLRSEHNTFKSTTYRFNSATPAAPTRINRKRDYTVWLPGLHFRHELRKNLILRESYNRSYSRPDVDRLVGGLNLNSTTGNISGGNPDLAPTTSDNYDVQLEYYTARGGLYSAGLFYKDMKGFYYSATTRFDTVGSDGYPIASPNGAYTYTRHENALGARNYGVELIARQKLFFLPKPFDGLGVSLSSTLTESNGRYPGRLAENLPTYGFSDKIYYAALEYTAGKFRGQLSYRYRSAYLEGLDIDNTLDDYFGELRSLDWESSYQLNRKLRLTFDVNNITDEPKMSYQGFNRPDNPEDFYEYSWRATFGVSYRF